MCWRLPEPTDCVFGRRLRNGTFGGSAAAARYAAGRRSERHHHVGADGMLTTNRRGRKLCQKWQEGQCEPFRVANARVTGALWTNAPDVCRLATGPRSCGATSASDSKLTTPMVPG